MQRVKIVFKLLLFLLLIYFGLRLIFCLLYFNPAHLSFSVNSRVFYWGIRMDIAAIFYINIPFLLYYFFLDFLLSPVWQRRIAVTLFSVVNLFFVAINFIDLVYFRYNLRRSTVDLFYAFGDSVHSFGGLLKLYWWVVLAFIGLCILFVYVVKKILSEQKCFSRERGIGRWLAPLVFLGVLFFLARGGDKRPIVPATALLHTDAVLQPAVNNSSLNLLYSWLRASSKPERKNYFTPASLDSIYTIRRQYDHTAAFEKKNVVVFVLESFTADFFANGAYHAQTPFFDSLMKKSTVCTQAFANGHESVMGLTAMLGSLPPFTEEPLFISNYSAVPFRGIGTLLKEEGYKTSFFMGAEYDHFNFAKLCRMTGIDQYYSKDTYGQPGHDDGNWGIYDGFFFPYFGSTLSATQQPFFSVLFNISSHPPFAIPAAERDQFHVPGQDAQRNSISYVDHCFKELFEQIKTQPWFANTLFVFCADHTLLEMTSHQSYLYNAYHIPLFLYDPRDTISKEITKPVEQLDIVPTILDKLNYSKPFMSFGNSFLRDQPGFAICRKNDGYQLIDSAFITGYDDRSDKVLYQYNYKTDSSLAKNLVTTNDPFLRQQEVLMKAIIQRFNNSLLDQRLLIKQ